MSPIPAKLARALFSKAHGMAGARIGYAMAAREVIGAFEKNRLHFGVNIVAQEGARGLLRDREFLQGVVKAVEEGRGEHAALAARLGFGRLAVGDELRRD